MTSEEIVERIDRMIRINKMNDATTISLTETRDELRAMSLKRGLKSSNNENKVETIVVNNNREKEYLSYIKQLGDIIKQNHKDINELSMKYTQLTIRQMHDRI